MRAPGSTSSGNPDGSRLPEPRALGAAPADGAAAPDARRPRWASVVAATAAVTMGAAMATAADGPPCGTGGDCFTELATPGCVDKACCEAVCGVDPFCCEVVWDRFCAARAAVDCAGCGAPEAGSCVKTRTVPACGNEGCCVAVCAVDPWCCGVTWDGFCVDRAYEICQLCGEPGSGSCFAFRLRPFCDDAACCESVCTADPACCEIDWDLGCISLATTRCAGCGDGAGSCLAAHGGVGCSEPGCCLLVCTTDPSCCDDAWDAACAALAIERCTACGVAEAGSCLEVHEMPACSDEACCEEVCGLDPFCCEFAWDARCAEEAVARCVERCGGSLAGGCCDPHPNGHCSDATCCAAVCAVEPGCCGGPWEEWCAHVAWSLCDSCCETCRGDFDVDGAIDAIDLVMLLQNWVSPSGGIECGFDLTADFRVDASDLTVLLARWGPCPGR